MRGIWRIVALAAVAMGLSVVFLVRNDGGGASNEGASGAGGTSAGTGEVPESCMGDVGADPAFAVRAQTEPDSPRMDGTTYRFMVDRAGAPVSGARVCVTLDMPGMNMEQGHEAVEVEPGRYETSFDLPMRGRWIGAVRVMPPAGAGAVVPVQFDVE